MHATTMKRIAIDLGVSITTVSKVLNNHDDIGEATRTRVLAKVEELGYQRNAVARSLSLRRTHTLGIVIPDLMHSFFVEIIAGIEPVASVRGYGLLLCSSGEDPHKERGLKAPEEWIVRGGFMEGDGYRAMKRLLTVRPRIDAVFAANDPAAIGAMKAIWEAGLRVPDDIAIVGVGDIALGDLLRVPLTTVGWSRRDQGRHAAELLLNGLDLEADPPQRVIIPPRLIVRESSGADSPFVS